MARIEDLKVLIISLPGAEDRRARMRRQLDPLGFDYAFFDAVDGRGLDVPAHRAYDARRRRAFGRDMAGCELGCLLSHRAVYERMLAERLDPVLVLEDDAVLADDFKAVLAALLDTTQSYDLVRFIGKAKLARLRQRRICCLCQGHWLTRLETTPGDAYAYLIRLSGAEKLLPHLQRNWLPVDALMGRRWQHGLDWFIVQPAVADFDQGSDSQIEPKRFDKTLQIGGMERALYPLTRALHKLGDGLGKRWSYWSSWVEDRRRGQEAGPTRVGR